MSSGGKEVVLYSFTGGASGWGPVAGLALDKKENLYGTAALGGAGTYCCGVAFKLNRKHQETVLHTFSGAADGGSPETGMIRDGNGDLYGTALLGSYGNGVIFKLTP